MKLNKNRIQTGVLSWLLLVGLFCASGQTVLYEEDMGVPTANTLIGNYDGWQTTSVTYVGNGTCDVRTSSASTGYGGASGGGNVLINDTVKWFQVSGLNTTATGLTVKLYCGLRKTASDNGSRFLVEFSTDSLVWVSLPMEDTLPSGTGTSGWYRVCFPNVPAHPHLHLRFSSLAQVEYRLDDIRITDGDEVVLETVETPTCIPSGGTFYEPQQVFLSCETPGAAIRYTLDGTTPDAQSPLYGGLLNINSTCTLKAIATHDNMYTSLVMTEQFAIIDTNSLVELPFDISGNSESTHADIKTMPGFRSHKLGTSYANGSAKFESKNAGLAMLTAHLDGSPGALSFELRGVKGGTPSSYSGIIFLVCESPDGVQWSTVATLNEADIGTDEFSHFGELPLSGATRYVRWQLAAAVSGNTQLNNIVITKQPEEGGEGEESGVVHHDDIVLNPCPNPARGFFRWPLRDVAECMEMYDAAGALVRRWRDVQDGERLDLSGVAPGYYILKATTSSGRMTKSLIVR